MIRDSRRASTSSLASERPSRHSSGSSMWSQRDLPKRESFELQGEKIQPESAPKKSSPRPTSRPSLAGVVIAQAEGEGGPAVSRQAFAGNPVRSYLQTKVGPKVFRSRIQRVSVSDSVPDHQSKAQGQKSQRQQRRSEDTPLTLDSDPVDNNPFLDSFVDKTDHDLFQQCREHLGAINQCTQLQQFINDEMRSQAELNQMVYDSMKTRSQRVKKQTETSAGPMEPGWVDQAFDDMSQYVSEQAHRHQVYSVTLVNQSTAIQQSLDSHKELMEKTKQEQDALEKLVNAVSKKGSATTPSMSFFQATCVFEGVRKPRLKLISELDYLTTQVKSITKHREDVESLLDRLEKTERTEKDAWQLQLKIEEARTKKDLLTSRHAQLDEELKMAVAKVKSFYLNHRDKMVEVVNVFRQHRIRCDSTLRKSFSLLQAATTGDPEVVQSLDALKGNWLSPVLDPRASDSGEPHIDSSGSVTTNHTPDKQRVGASSRTSSNIKRQSNHDKNPLQSKKVYFGGTEHTTSDFSQLRAAVKSNQRVTSDDDTSSNHPLSEEETHVTRDPQYGLLQQSSESRIWDGQDAHHEKGKEGGTGPSNGITELAEEPPRRLLSPVKCSSSRGSLRAGSKEDNANSETSERTLEKCIHFSKSTIKSPDSRTKNETTSSLVRIKNGTLKKEYSFERNTIIPSTPEQDTDGHISKQSPCKPTVCGVDNKIEAARSLQASRSASSSRDKPSDRRSQANAKVGSLRDYRERGQSQSPVKPGRGIKRDLPRNHSDSQSTEAKPTSRSSHDTRIILTTEPKGTDPLERVASTGQETMKESHGCQAGSPSVGSTKEPLVKGHARRPLKSNSKNSPCSSSSETGVAQDTTIILTPQPCKREAATGEKTKFVDSGVQNKRDGGEVNFIGDSSFKDSKSALKRIPPDVGESSADLTTQSDTRSAVPEPGKRRVAFSDVESRSNEISYISRPSSAMSGCERGILKKKPPDGGTDASRQTKTTIVREDKILIGHARADTRHESGSSRPSAGSGDPPTPRHQRQSESPCSKSAVAADVRSCAGVNAKRVTYCGQDAFIPEDSSCRDSESDSLSSSSPSSEESMQEEETRAIASPHSQACEDHIQLKKDCAKIRNDCNNVRDFLQERKILKAEEEEDKINRLINKYANARRGLSDLSKNYNNSETMGSFEKFRDDGHEGGVVGQMVGIGRTDRLEFDNESKESGEDENDREKGDSQRWREKAKSIGRGRVAKEGRDSTEGRNWYESLRCWEERKDRQVRNGRLDQEDKKEREGRDNINRDDSMDNKGGGEGEAYVAKIMTEGYGLESNNNMDTRESITWRKMKERRGKEEYREDKTYTDGSIECRDRKKSDYKKGKEAGEVNNRRMPKEYRETRNYSLEKEARDINDCPRVIGRGENDDFTREKQIWNETDFRKERKRKELSGHRKGKQSKEISDYRRVRESSEITDQWRERESREVRDAWLEMKSKEKGEHWKERGSMGIVDYSKDRKSNEINDSTTYIQSKRCTEIKWEAEVEEDQKSMKLKENEELRDGGHETGGKVSISASAALLGSSGPRLVKVCAVRPIPTDQLDHGPRPVSAPTPLATTAILSSGSGQVFRANNSVSPSLSSTPSTSDSEKRELIARLRQFEVSAGQFVVVTSSRETNGSGCGVSGRGRGHNIGEDLPPPPPTRTQGFSEEIGGATTSEGLSYAVQPCQWSAQLYSDGGHNSQEESHDNEVVSQCTDKAVGEPCTPRSQVSMSRENLGQISPGRRDGTVNGIRHRLFQQTNAPMMAELGDSNPSRESVPRLASRYGTPDAECLIGRECPRPTLNRALDISNSVRRNADSGGDSPWSHTLQEVAGRNEPCFDHLFSASAAGNSCVRSVGKRTAAGSVSFRGAVCDKPLKSCLKRSKYTSSVHFRHNLAVSMSQNADGGKGDAMASAPSSAPPSFFSKSAHSGSMVVQSAISQDRNPDRGWHGRGVARVRNPNNASTSRDRSATPTFGNRRKRVQFRESIMYSEARETVSELLHLELDVDAGFKTSPTKTNESEQDSNASNNNIHVSSSEALKHTQPCAHSVLVCTTERSRTETRAVAWTDSSLVLVRVRSRVVRAVPRPQRNQRWCEALLEM